MAEDLLQGLDYSGGPQYCYFTNLSKQAYGFDVNSADLDFVELLRLSGATPKDLVDNIRVGIVLHDAATGRIAYVNKEFAHMVGRSCECLAFGETTLLDLTHCDDVLQSVRLQRELSAGHLDSFRIEKRYLRLDGTIIWAKVSESVLRRNGDITWSIALVEDVSEEKLFKSKLMAVESVAAIATWNWSVKSDVVTISPSYNFLHGLPSDHPGPNLHSALLNVHPDDRPHFQKTIARGLAERSGYTEEYRIVLPNGELRWLRTTATCIYDAVGEVSHLVGATIDITDVKTRRPLKTISPAMQMVLKHIHEQWQQPISLKELGELYGVSSRTIHNYFDAQGTTPNKYIRGVRLRHARQKLLESQRNTTVTAIALQCGFLNIGHFAKAYKTEFGELPSETRRAFGKSVT